MRRLLGIVTIAVTSFSFATAANAQTFPHRTASPAQLDTAKHACEAAIDRRLQHISVLQNALNSSQHVTADHKSTLQTQLSDAQSGLQQLRTKIDGDTDGATLRSDCRSIVEDYRVYVLLSPKVREVLVADWETAIADHLSEIATKIQTAIDKAKAKGKDTTTAQSDLDAMKTQTTDAKTAASGVPGSVINLQAHDWPGAHDTLVRGRETLRTARQDLRTARQDGWNAVQALRQS